MLFMRFKHFVQYLFRNFVGRNERVDRHGHKCSVVIACNSRFSRNAFERFNLLDKTSHGDRQISDRDRFRPVFRHDTVDFHCGVIRNACDRSVIHRVNRLNIVLVIVNRADQVAGGITVICAAALFKLGRFDRQLRIFIQLKQFLFNLLNNLCTRSFRFEASSSCSSISCVL